MKDVFSTLKTRIATFFQLSSINVAIVLLYRLAFRARLFERLLPTGKTYRDPLFDLSPVTKNFPIDDPSKTSTLKDAEELRHGRMRLFSHRFWQVGSPPDWFVNPINGKRLTHPDVHWSRVADFDGEIGDIKGIWELSRFDWALLLARAYRLTGDSRYLTFLNAWASNWIKLNLLNMGPNWKCGQETAIRMMQTLLAAFILDQHRTPTPGLVRFVTEHCSRIAPTIRYAIAQDNNHGTSEAAGLYIGGAWLLACAESGRPRSAKQSLRWHCLGKRWLENRVRKLIAPDGSFSQYSLNYHRVALDTLNLVEFWRREFDLPAFSDLFYERAQAAVHWLDQMIDPETGDGPNLGANDGARLFVLSATGYRDYRPTAQLGSGLFSGEKIYPRGVWDEPLAWLTLNKVSYPTAIRKRNSCTMRDGGYVMMHFPLSWAVIRFPNFRFRPAHADAFHFDLWHKGRNLLRDSGSYSYHTDESWRGYFPGTAAHNTIEFDGRDQMPRLGRFLFGAWLKTKQAGELILDDSPFEGGRGMFLSWRGSYRDYQGCQHTRTVSSNGVIWRISDDIAGFETKAVLRWRLAPGHWTIEGMMCTGELATLTIDSSVPVTRCELVEGWESRYYMATTNLPVVEVEVKPPRAIFTTVIRLKD